MKSAPMVPGVEEVAHLDGRGAMSENRRTRIVGDALEIDCDVGFKVIQEPGYLAIGFRCHVMELIEWRDQAGAHLALVIAPIGNPDELKARSVVALEKVGGQISGGMLAEIRRQISDPDLVASPDLPCPQW